MYRMRRTICKFRHLLERHALTERLFALSRALLKRHGLMIKTMMRRSLRRHRPRKKGEAAGSGDEINEEGAYMVLWDEGPYRYGYAGFGPPCSGNAGQRARRHEDGGMFARGGGGIRPT